MAMLSTPGIEVCAVTGDRYVEQILCAPVQASCAAAFPDDVITSAQVQEVYSSLCQSDPLTPLLPPSATDDGKRLFACQMHTPDVG